MIICADGSKYYKLGLHVHTTLSDGQKTPEAVAAEYKANGYDAIALTDHWKYGAGGQLEGLHILSGCEYNLGGGDTIEGVMHIIGFGMKQDPQIPRDASRNQVVAAIQSAGGIAVLGHPNWSLNTLKDAEQLEDVAFTEVYNAVSEAHNSLRAYSDYFVDVCANAGIYYHLLATDDAHFYDGSDSCKGWVMVKAEALTDEALLEGLRRGDFYATQGPELSVKREGNKLVVDCSPCSVIGTLSNGTYAQNRTARGDGVTHFEYELREHEQWIRVEAIDAEGKHAWSNIFVNE